MLSLLGQWFGHDAHPTSAALRKRCAARGWTLKRNREGEGFVVEPGGRSPWRLEWGPSQRSYLAGHELRLRAMVGIDPQTFAVLMPAGLMAQLEQQVYLQSTQSVKTQLDEHLPEEMRWLAMGHHLSPRRLGGLGGPFEAVGNVPGWMGDWLAEPFASRLLAFADVPQGHKDAWPRTPAMALMIKRGELIWRVQMEAPSVHRLEAAVEVFEAAWQQAMPFSESQPQAL
ncbi:hypothetical protein [Ideonella sp.]|uniref:hypothetical protein n=1 Tax=Ideonella sp. TaxID=1929293 RepID=UPI0037BFF309